MVLTIYIYRYGCIQIHVMHQSEADHQSGLPMGYFHSEKFVSFHINQVDLSIFKNRILVNIETVCFIWLNL